MTAEQNQNHNFWVLQKTVESSKNYLRNERPFKSCLKNYHTFLQKTLFKNKELKKNKIGPDISSWQKQDSTD